MPDNISTASRLFPAFKPPEHLDIYEMRGSSHEVKLTVATLVGLVNRTQPRVYLSSRQDDPFWLQEVFADIPQTFSTLRGKDILTSLLSAYREKVQGLIIYDPALNDSINIATMLAGQQNGIIVSPAQAIKLQEVPYALPIITDLRTYHWHTRLQAYEWACNNLLATSSQQLVAGLSPDIALGIRPFLVATRAFIYWLHPLHMLPQPPQTNRHSERRLMQQILHAFQPGTPHLGWFLQEGSGVSLTSRAALPVLASDFFTNLEVWAATPQQHVQATPTSVVTASQSPEQKIYVSFTLSEGDNFQYLQERMLHLWQDPARGSVPIGWTISPALLEAAPRMAAFYMRTVTPSDELIAGPGGIGYMYPSRWPATHLAEFLQITGRAMQQMNLSTVEVLDSNFWLHPILMSRAITQGAGMALLNRTLQKRYAETLLSYGVQGILSGGGQTQARWNSVSGIPVYQNVGIAHSVEEALALLRSAASKQQNRPAFLNLYVLAWNLTPSDLQSVVQQLGSEYEVVTPGTLLHLISQQR